MPHHGSELHMHFHRRWNSFMVHGARYSIIESLHGVSWGSWEGHSVGNRRLQQCVMSLPNSELCLSRAIVYKHPPFHLVGTPLKLSLKATVPASAADCDNQLLRYTSTSTYASTNLLLPWSLSGHWERWSPPRRDLPGLLGLLWSSSWTQSKDSPKWDWMWLTKF